MTPIVSQPIENYCEQHSSPASPIGNAIAAFTKQNVEMPQMLIGPLEGAFLGLLVTLTRARRVLEIGCFTGYSALAMAERLPANGELITLDIDAQNLKLAESFWQQSPHASKIKPILGPALSSLRTLKGPFDLVFIDADKTNYQNYFDATWPLLSETGVIAVDNCLWNGEVLQPGGDADTQAIKSFNTDIAKRTDLEKTIGLKRCCARLNFVVSPRKSLYSHLDFARK